MPKHFWADAVSTACFLINRMPSSVLNWVTLFQTLFPHKSLFPIKPRVFGCTFFVRDVRYHVSKLDPKSLKLSSLVTLEFRRGIGVTVLLFDVTLCFMMLYSLKLLRFPFLLLLLVRGRRMIY